MSRKRSYLLVGLTALFLGLISTHGKAQEATDNIYVYGTVKDYVSAAKLQGVSVIVHKDDVRMAALLTDSLGRYEVSFDYDHVYRLWFMQAGMVTKHVVIDARDIPADLRAGGHGMNIDITLFKAMPNLDMSVLDQPIGMAQYSPADSAITWNLEYTESIRARVSQAMNRMDSLNKVMATGR